MLKVKICGITTTQDAKLAEHSGADYIGINFCPVSKRQVSLDQAKTILDVLSTAIPVGVFAVLPPTVIAELTETLQLPMVQVYEPLQDMDINAEVIFSQCISADAVVGQNVSQTADYYLWDRYRPDMLDATGERFDWRHLQGDLSKSFVAGGLTCADIAILAQKKPYALDVCSSIEDRPGDKNPHLLRQFIGEVKTHG